MISAGVQDPDVVIAGRVIDSVGAVVVGASVVLLSRQTNAERKAVTDNEGEFHFNSVPAGDYKLTFSSPGFAATSKTISAKPGNSEQLLVSLNPNVLRQAVTVTGGNAQDNLATTAMSATRTDIPLMDTPQSIAVVSKTVLEDQQVLRIGDAARNVSGVTRAIGYTEAADKYSIRGFLVDYSLKNGFKNNSILTLTDVANVERVEILKGPSSILFGRLDPGGIVNTVTKQPLSEQHYSAEMQFSRYGFYRPSIDLTGPLNASKTLMYRFNGAYERAGSHRDFVKAQTVFLAPALTWKVGRMTTLTTEGEYLRHQGIPDGGLFSSPISLHLPINLNVGEPADNIRNKNKRASYYLTHIFNEHWWLTNAFSSLLIDAIHPQVFPPVSRLRPDGHTLDRTLLDQAETGRAFFSRVDVVGKLSTGALHHTLLMGFELGRERYESSLSTYAIAPLDINQPVYGAPFPSGRKPDQIRRQGADTLGLYLQDQLAITKKWKILLGGRFDLASTHYFDLAGLNPQPGNAGPGSEPDGGLPPPPPPPPPSGPRTQSSEEHPRAFSPRAGIVYQPATPVSLYFSYSSSFNPLQIDQYLPFTQLHPFKAKQYETGVKLDLFEARLQTTMSLYDIKYTGFPIPDFKNPFATPSFTGFKKSKGAELDVNAQIQPGWRVTATYGYNLGRQKVGFPGTQLLNSPRNSASLWSVYQLPGGRLQAMSFGAGAFYVGERTISLIGNLQLPAYVRADAMIAYRLSHWTLQLNIKNLTNRKYYETDAEQSMIIPASPIRAVVRIRFHF